MLKRFLGALMFLFLAACNKEGTGAKASEWKATPQGYQVKWLEAGSFASGRTTWDRVACDFDAAVARAAHQLNVRYGLPQEQVYAAARRVYYTAYDDYRIYLHEWTADAGFVEYASGVTKLARDSGGFGGDAILLAYWSDSSYDLDPPFRAMADELAHLFGH